MRCSSLSLALVLVGAEVYAAHAEKLAKDCTDEGNCIKTGCCNKPGTKCFRKNHKYAACLETCQTGFHTWEPAPYNKEEWDCVELTFGCNAMSKPCGVWEGYKGTPCCEWGCTCNKTKWGMACKATNASGAYTCDKAHEGESDTSDPSANFDARKVGDLPIPRSPTIATGIPLTGFAALAALGAFALALRVARTPARGHGHVLAPDSNAHEALKPPSNADEPGEEVQLAPGSTE